MKIIIGAMVSLIYWLMVEANVK